MNYSYRDIIKLKFPNKKPQRYNDHTYNGIVWNQLDETPNPTQLDLDLAIQNEMILNTNLTSGSFVKSISIPAISGTSQITYGDLVPVITDGTEILRVPFEATNPLSKLLITGSFVVNSSASNRNIILALFKDTVCIGVTCINIVTGNRVQNLSFSFTDTDLGSSFNSTIPIYTLRIGASNSTLWSVNKSNSTLFNGLMDKNSAIFLGYN